MIIQREKVFTLPELFYQAQNKDNEFKKSRKCERCTLIVFITYLAAIVCVSVWYESYIKLYLPFKTLSKSPKDENDYLFGTEL